MADEKRRKSPEILQVVETIAALITAAFGLIAALAWNTAISDAVKQYLSAGNAITRRVHICHPGHHIGSGHDHLDRQGRVQVSQYGHEMTGTTLTLLF